MTSVKLGPVNPRWVRSLVLFVAAGVLMYLAAMLMNGWSQTVDIIRRIGILQLFALAMLSSTAYLWRFGRWAYVLKYFACKVPLVPNFLIYTAGLALTTSPGKVGETFRSVLLVSRGVKLNQSLAAFLADRLSDVLGVCLLGAVASRYAGWHTAWLLSFLTALLFAASLLLAFVINRSLDEPIWRWLMARVGWPLLGTLRMTLSDWAAVWSPARVIAFGLAAMMAFGTQALVFSHLCTFSGVELTASAAVAIFVNATLFGAASLVPGGLGTMEAALVLQLGELGVSVPVAVSLAVATRLVTLWFGIGLGILSLLMLSRARTDSQ